MIGLRAVLLLAGLGAATYGTLLLLRLDLPDLLDVGLWMVGGVVLHDAVIAPVTVVGVLLLRRVVGADWRTPLTVGAVVLLTVTATAIPVLGRFGARPDNPTLLDRDYTAGWLLLAGAVLLGVLAAGLLARRRASSRQPAA